MAGIKRPEPFGPTKRNISGRTAAACPYGRGGELENGTSGVAFVLDLTERKRAGAEARRERGALTKKVGERGSYARRRRSWRMRPASQQWDSLRPRSPMRLASRSPRRSPMRGRVCAGSAPTRRDLDEVRQALDGIVRDGERAGEVVGRIAASSRRSRRETIASRSTQRFSR